MTRSTQSDDTRILEAGSLSLLLLQRGEAHISGRLVSLLAWTGPIYHKSRSSFNRREPPLLYKFLQLYFRVIIHDTRLTGALAL